jgi:hypothetical protein
MRRRTSTVGDQLRPVSKALTDSPAQRHECALASLRGNVLAQSFTPADGSPAFALVAGERVFLPAYIPYVGQAYFGFRPRVLCYAINQNLSQHASWSDELTSAWASDSELGLDRLNRSASCGHGIPIRPYAEGFIPLAALLAISVHAPDYRCELPELIDDVIAVTNFVKFSTADDAAAASIPTSWWRECAARYVAKEIETLEPDIVIGFGRQVVSELHRVLETLPLGSGAPRLLACRFPRRIASVKARPVADDEERAWEQVQRLVARIKPPPQGARHAWRMLKFPGYFLTIRKEWQR